MSTVEIDLSDLETDDPMPVRRRFVPSPYQAAIFDWIKNGSGDAIVNAVAGSGKTTTLVEGSRFIWQAGARTALFCAFNQHIVKELASRLDGMACRTIHSIGLETVKQRIGSEVQVEGSKYAKLCRAEAYGLSERTGANREEIIASLGDLVSYSHATLPRGTVERLEMVERYGLELPCEFRDLEPALDRILKAGIEQAEKERVLSFSDMLWLCHVWKLQPTRVDWLFVDECQDLNRAQLELILKMGGRRIFVGDPRQAIYGFSGADARSYASIKERTGAVEFPLSVSYRCPVLVVREAQRIVPGIEARQGADLGMVRYVAESKLYSEVKEDDLLLCRMNAPLIATCLELLARKVPARIRGRDIGKHLTGVVKKVAKEPMFKFKNFPRHLHDYTQKQVEKLAKQDGTEARIEMLRDCEAALATCFLATEARDTYLFCEDIESLFDDNRAAVYLSTVHKAKGLEADRVFILKPERLPLQWAGQQAWEYEQEMNLKYVAVTRARSELIFVT